MFRCHRHSPKQEEQEDGEVTFTTAAHSKCHETACVCTSSARLSKACLSSAKSHRSGILEAAAASARTVKEWTGIIDGEGICATQAQRG